MKQQLNTMQVILADIILFLLQILMYYYYPGLNLHLNAKERTQMYGLYRTARVASFSSPWRAKTGT